MAYGRYDRGRDHREPRGTRSSWDDDRGSRYSGERDERGFFERAGDEISSWFGDDDPTTKRILEGILAQEEEHADELSDLLQKTPL